MPKISELKAKMEELAKVIMFETDYEFLKYYLEEYICCYCKIRLMQDEIDRLSVVLN